MLVKYFTMECILVCAETFPSKVRGIGVKITSENEKSYFIKKEVGQCYKNLI